MILITTKRDPGDNLLDDDPYDRLLRWISGRPVVELSRIPPMLVAFRTPEWTS